MRKQCAAFILALYDSVKIKSEVCLVRKNISQSIIIHQLICFQKRMKNTNIWFCIQMTVCFFKIKVSILEDANEKGFLWLVIYLIEAYVFVAWLCFPRLPILGSYFPFLLSLVITFISLTVFSKINISPFSNIMLYSSKWEIKFNIKEKIY